MTKGLKIFRMEMWGALGALAAGVCCLAASWLSAVLSSIGIGFLAHYAFLAPFLTVCLGLALVGAWRYSCEHHSKTQLWISLAGAVLLALGLIFDHRVAYVGMALLIGVSAYAQVKDRKGGGQAQSAALRGSAESETP